MIVPTPSSLARSARRLDRHVRGMTGVLAHMRAGAVMRLHFARGKPVWLLSPGSEVPLEVAALVIAHPNVCGVGDSLFTLSS